MNFLRRNNDFRGRLFSKYIFGFLILLVILISAFIFSGWKSPVYSFASSFWKIRNAFAGFVADNIEVFKSKSALSIENKNLRIELRNIETERVLSDSLKEENENLKSLLGRKKNDKELLSAILAKPDFSPYDTIIIDVGTSDGVSVGDRAKSSDGMTFIGYVSEVFDFESKVTLYSSPGEKVRILIGRNYVMKEALGIGGGNFTLELPREFDVSEGDPVVIPSISPNIFGIIEKIEFKESDPYETVLFKSPVNLSELKWVIVTLKDKKQ